MEGRSVRSYLGAVPARRFARTRFFFSSELFACEVPAFPGPFSPRLSNLLLQSLLVLRDRGRDGHHGRA